MSTLYNFRHIAQIVIEAATPLMVGSGEKGAETDARVLLDVNGLPMIPGTSIAGVLRHMAGDEGIFNKEEIAKIFGNKDGKDERGSKVIISEARMLGEDGNPIDGLCTLPESEFIEMFKSLPIRQHVRITDKGAAADEGKFDCQVVFAGTRFVFEIEILSDSDKDRTLENIVSLLQMKSFRLGGGTRRGYGDMTAVSIKKAVIDLCDDKQRGLYLRKTSSFEPEWEAWTDCPVVVAEEKISDCFRLELSPEDFFLFGSGYNDDEVDMTSVQEPKILWSGSKTAKEYLIPASSVKGAVAHRTAFYYNKLKERYVGNADPDKAPKIGSENEAVLSLFGSEDEKSPKRGNVLISDVYLEKVVSDKILNHVSIDRFTGGAIEAALFSEKVSYLCDENPVVIEFIIAKKAYENDEKIKEAFICALKDITTGMLPLGGGVNRGNGCFKGVLKLNGEMI